MALENGHGKRTLMNTNFIADALSLHKNDIYGATNMLSTCATYTRLYRISPTFLLGSSALQGASLDLFAVAMTEYFLVLSSNLSQYELVLRFAWESLDVPIVMQLEKSSCSITINQFLDDILMLINICVI